MTPIPTDGRTASTTTRCRNCNAHVSADFARVFGDNDDRVYRCLDCADASEILRARIEE